MNSSPGKKPEPTKAEVKPEGAKKQAFEQSLARLEEIVRRMESANLPLDEAMKLFEEGMQLSRDCQKQLEQAEARVEILLKKAGGEMIWTGIHEDFAYHITDPRFFSPDVPLAFQFADRRRGNEQSAFVQDLIHLGAWTISAGLRWDHYQLLLNRQVHDVEQATSGARLAREDLAQPDGRAHRRSIESRTRDRY